MRPQQMNGKSLKRSRGTPISGVHSLDQLTKYLSHFGQSRVVREQTSFKVSQGYVVHFATNEEKRLLQQYTSAMGKDGIAHQARYKDIEKMMINIWHETYHRKMSIDDRVIFLVLEPIQNMPDQPLAHTWTGLMLEYIPKREHNERGQIFYGATGYAPYLVDHIQQQANTNFTTKQTLPEYFQNLLKLADRMRSRCYRRVRCSNNNNSLTTTLMALCKGTFSDGSFSLTTPEQRMLNDGKSIWHHDSIFATLLGLNLTHDPSEIELLTNTMQYNNNSTKKKSKAEQTIVSKPPPMPVPSAQPIKPAKPTQTAQPTTLRLFPTNNTYTIKMFQQHLQELSLKFPQITILKNNTPLFELSTTVEQLNLNLSNLSSCKYSVTDLPIVQIWFLVLKNLEPYFAKQLLHKILMAEQFGPTSPSHNQFFSDSNQPPRLSKLDYTLIDFHKDLTQVNDNSPQLDLTTLLAQLHWLIENCSDREKVNLELSTDTKLCLHMQFDNDRATPTLLTNLWRIIRYVDNAHLRQQCINSTLTAIQFGISNHADPDEHQTENIIVL